MLDSDKTSLLVIISYFAKNCILVCWKNENHNWKVGGFKQVVDFFAIRKNV
jgi:hypothetical protein